ncbi:MAG: thiamine-phosphate synthase, partial [Myxococcales bacterium]|nr:thiamine-phosphate synthase [Myxococcales bacterium]
MASPPRLLLITDRKATKGRPLVDVVRAALSGVPAARRGEVAVALREKDLEARVLLDLARALRAVTHAAGAALFVNDRLDVALAAEADGVHLGGRSLSPADVARVAAQVGDRAHQPGRTARELLARRRRIRALRGPLEQRRADPFLQRADATAERRLSHVAHVGRAREVARLAQCDEVFEPGKFHPLCI